MCSLWGSTQDIQMTRAIRPYILVQTNPQAINKRQPLTISARLYDRDTNQPLPVRKIFLNIISMKDGHTIWPNEVVRVNDWKFDILIGTDNMKEGHTYLVRVSNNRNLSPMGATEFEVIKDNQTPLLLFPIPLPVREPTDDLVRRQIEKLKFVTQMDARVCPLCLENSLEHSPGLQPGEYDPNEPIPRIPVHFNCRCTYDVIFNMEFEKTFQAVQEVYIVAQKTLEQRKMNEILKAISFIDRMPA